MPWWGVAQTGESSPFISTTATSLEIRVQETLVEASHLGVYSSQLNFLLPTIRL
jgi:hypothetical protein